MGFEFGLRCRQRSCVSAPLTSPFEAFEPFESERGLSCGLEIDHKLELGGKHDRTIAQLLALENPPDINARQKICSSKVGPQPISRRPP